MPPVLRNILAVLVGLVIGMAVNGLIISVSGKLVSLPEGVNPNDLESIKENIHLFRPINFLMPFLAHALGTLTGAWLTALIAATYKLRFALGVGVAFLAAGIANCFMIPAPTWFMVVDVIFAYIPMALLGGRLGGGKNLGA